MTGLDFLLACDRRADKTIIRLPLLWGIPDTWYTSLRGYEVTRFQVGPPCIMTRNQYYAWSRVQTHTKISWEPLIEDHMYTYCIWIQYYYLVFTAYRGTMIGKIDPKCCTYFSVVSRICLLWAYALRWRNTCCERTVFNVKSVGVKFSCSKNWFRFFRPKLRYHFRGMKNW
jgi:hypothetical protein